MTRKMIIPLLFGLLGCAILLSLGTWQMQRLGWKRAMLAEIEARIVDAPVPLPAAPDSLRDRYLPVTAEGRLTGEAVLVLGSLKNVGAIHRVISVLDTDGRRVLVDRGFREVAGHAGQTETGPLRVTGNLQWPSESDSFTPPPDDKGGVPLYFARDVPGIAARLGTEPVLIVAREVAPTDPELTPLPVSTAGIPNDHLGYAITWFSLAIVWAGMTGFLLWRMRQRTV